MSTPANARLAGARQGEARGLRRLLARAAARRLSVFVVPGPEVARAAGLDLEAGGFSLAASPREANVLAVVGELPSNLARAAAVAYAQMPRPRATLLVGVQEAEPLPADVCAEAEQGSLAAAVGELRRALREGAFADEAGDFDAAALQTRTVHTCPMHPEVQSEEPGQCPKCGMDLVPTESSGEEETQHDHGAHEHGGNEDQGGHAHHGHGDAGDEDDDGGGGVDQGLPEPVAGEDFMSMVEMTRGTPRSSDGLQMEWVEAPFGPLFPGLPGGLYLRLTLDGDTVAQAETGSAAADRADFLRGPASDLPRRLAGLDPLSPYSYRLLALLALEGVSGLEPGGGERMRRLRAVEIERAASHAGWLSDFARVLGLDRLSRQAARMQLRVLARDRDLDSLAAEASRLRRRAMKPPFLARRLRGTARLSAAEPVPAGGAVARACGARTDARTDLEDYRALGFEPAPGDGGDALARLELRLREMEQSLSLAREALHASDASGEPDAGVRDLPDGSGEATVETPRGPAALRLVVEGGEISSAQFAVPSEALMGLVGAVAEQRELGEALAGVASLDISPWGLG